MKKKVFLILLIAVLAASAFLMGGCEARCLECGGTGLCGGCDGTGKTEYGKGNEPCQFCNGTGKCDKCDGSGKIILSAHAE
jgi:hypothetical protein